MSTKRIELADLDVVEIVSALRAQGDTYAKLSEARLGMAWTDAAAYYRRCAERCFATIVKLEESDRVAVETDEMDLGPDRRTQPGLDGDTGTWSD